MLKEAAALPAVTAKTFSSAPLQRFFNDPTDPQTAPTAEDSPKRAVRIPANRPRFTSTKLVLSEKPVWTGFASGLNKLLSYGAAFLSGTVSPDFRRTRPYRHTNPEAMQAAPTNVHHCGN